MTQRVNLSVVRNFQSACSVSDHLASVLLKAGSIALVLASTNIGWAQQLSSSRARISDCDSQPLPCDAPGVLPMYPLPLGVVPHRAAGDPDYWADPREDGGARGPEAVPGGDAPDSGMAAELDAGALGPGDAVGDFGDFDSSAFSLDANLASAGVQRGGFSSSPTMTGDLFGSGLAQITGAQTVSFQQILQGFILNDAQPGSPGAQLGFGSGSLPADLFSSGPGVDTTGDGLVDQFSILEPIPPSGAPIPAGSGFLFDGGTAVFLGRNQPQPQPEPFTDGDDWLIGYSYTQAIGLEGAPIVLAGPDVATRRVKLAENFSPEVRNRAYMNFSYFNNAFGGLGDVNRWVLGLEQILINDLFSVEFRLPMATTLGSRQDINAPGARNYELGNLTTIGKLVLYRDQRSIWTSGMGVTAPLADDARLMRGTDTLLQIRNESVHLLPFAAVLRRLNEDSIIQFITQLDIDVNGNQIRGDLAGGQLPVLGRLKDSTLLHLDASYHHTLIRRPRTQLVREVIGNAELHYTGSLENAGVVQGNGLTITDLARRFDVVNATFSSHWLLGDNVVVTPGISVPVTSGMNRQFNFEALLQVNYLR